MISPPIIGAISDGTGSLQTGLQITWMTVVLSGLAWGVGGYYLPDFEIPKSDAADSSNMEETTYWELIMGRTHKPTEAEGGANQGRDKDYSLENVAEREAILELSALKLNQAL